MVNYCNEVKVVETLCATILSGIHSLTMAHSRIAIATTVASTMTLAHAAGISSFVTGGVGGVHREGELSMDVSADLTELSRTPVVVISAGIKSILDIPRTLEVLETNSVPTVAYQTDEFPCFFSPNSGITSPARVDSAAEVASAYWAARALNLRHGMLVAVPPPDPAGESIEKAIQTALKEASERGLQGQAVTPFILKHVANSTKGASLSCNISLVKNNANVGTEIAMAIAEGQSATSVGVVANEYPRASQVIVMGGTVLDIVAKPTANTLLLGTSNPAECRESDGGVSRNIAEVLGRLGSEPLLFSAVGDDARGLAIQRRQAEYGIKNSHLTINVVKGANTATYLAVLEGETNDLHTACADMAVMSDIKAPTDTQLRQADTLVLDANPPLKILEETAEAATKLGVAVFFEPTSVPKAQQVASSPSFLRCVTAAFPNLDELIAMRDAARSATRREGSMPMDMDEIRSTSAQLLDHMAPERAYLVVTLGSQGVLLAARGASKADYQFRHFPVTEEVVVENCTGAGDTLCGAFIHAIRQGENLEEAVLLGMQAATVSLRSSSRTIAPALSELKPSI